LALIVFAITLFVSAFLLFLVQPMIGKMILPKLGGTPQVWNTCMLFFQTVLLAGYFYTHAATTYLRPRTQMILHSILLFLPLVLMLAMGRPFDVTGWVPPSGSNPIFATLLLLLTVVGVPFFVVSTSAPLLQKWFSFSGDPAAKDPYFLYGASNFGSMLSLAAYPFLVEPWFAVPTQTWIWFVCYIGLMILFFGSAALVWRQAESAHGEAPQLESPPASAVEPVLAAAAPVPAAQSSTAIQPSRMVGKKKGLKGAAATAPSAAPSVARKPAYDPVEAPVTFGRCVRWALLAAVPVSLMLGVTSYISTDLSPFPLVWAIPLALYLLTFILVFAKWPLEWTKEPHALVLYAMPLFAVPAFCFVLFTRNYAPVTLGTFFSFIAIFIITLALHGELAKDRPGPRNLTLFFLLMSFGGMLGGLFNAMIAPVVFTGIWEYPLAIIVACLLHPNLADHGFIDRKLLDAMPDMEKSFQESSDNFSRSMGNVPDGRPFLFTYVWDIAIGLMIALVAWYTTKYWVDMGNRFIALLGFLGMDAAELRHSFRNRGGVYLLAVYGLPLLLAIIVSARSWRFGLGIAGLLCFGYIFSDRGGQLYAGRSYFGVLRVLEEDEFLRNEKGQALYTEAEDLPPKEAEVRFNYLMHGSTYHGRNYQTNNLGRLATTYYHRFGPVGCVMERFNWFPGKQNTYDADARMPASFIGLGATSMGLPMAQLVDCWSEPPFATVGLGTGTMASYTRPFQHLAYYEIDDKIRAMSLPPSGKDPYFRYVKDALDRGGFVEIIMGDARLSLEREKEREQERLDKKIVEPTALRENYYHALVLDAFSSDAIPVHLITEEAIKLYMSKLAPDGVLLVHTSNRHLELIRPVADIAKALDLDWIVAHDPGGADRNSRRPPVPNRVNSLGHFGSEYIMLARKDRGLLDKTKLENAIRGYPPDKVTSDIRPRPENRQLGFAKEEGWYKLPAPGDAIWTDNYQNIVSIMR
jgi:hypothetical protein